MALTDGDHPDPERLAAYVDRVLDADARAAVEQHLASCRECRTIVTGVAIFADQPAGTASHRPPRPYAKGWTWTWVAGVTAAAAAVAIAVVATVMLTRSRPTPVDELVAAYDRERARPVEGRLTGGFRYAPAPVATRGGGQDLSPDVRIAAAHIEKRAAEDDTASSEAALGVALLAVREFDRGVAALERATESAPTNAAFQSDLAAAYLARAAWAGRSDDLPRALAAADRALAANPAQLEAKFNRALALEALHMDDQAAAAWTAYAASDPASGWAHEATQRADAIRARSRTPSGRASPDRQQMRERLEDVLLAHWGAAVLDRDAAGASDALRQCDDAASVLASAGGDTMPIDELRRIHVLVAKGNRADVDEIARGHVGYGRAREAFLHDRLQEASERMTDAAAAFRRVGSAYQSWAPIYQAIAHRIAGAATSALDDLRAGTDLARTPQAYFNLRGRIAWTRGAALETLGRFDVARSALQAAVDQFAAAGEWENVATIEMGLAEANWYLGDAASTWQHELNAVGRLSTIRSASRRNAVLLEASTFALGSGLPESALEFQDALIALVDRDGTDLGRADAYRSRARILGRLDRLEEANRSAVLSADAAARIEDQGLRMRALAELDLVRAELSLDGDAQQSVAATSTALEYAQRNGYAVRAAELLTLRAAARERQRDADEAERDFRGAIDLIASLRLEIAKVPDQIQALERQRAAVRGLVRLEAVDRNQTDAALRVAEAGRARSAIVASGREAPVDPLAVRSTLGGDTALVYYAVLDDRVLTWVITKERVWTRAEPIAETKLAAEVRRLTRVAEDGASYQQLAIAASEVADRFVIPALDAASGKARIVFVPDGALTALPFSALPDRRGRPIVESATVVVAPSVTAFLNESDRLAAFAPQSVLAVGDGHESNGAEWPHLAHADSEATSVGRLYRRADVVTGPDATRSRILADDHDVIHFAGHTVSNLEFPLLGRLLLAPGGDEDSGALFVSDILQRRFTRTALVVLASCESASGKSIAGEGALSVARAFINAGVPSVVASLWTIDDQLETIMPAFHRALLQRADPAAALRDSQLAWLGAHADSPVRAWAGFEALGGSRPPSTED